MIDQLFMKDLAYDLAPPLDTEQPATLLASGPATSDVGQVSVQGYDPSRNTAGGAFVGTRLNTPKAGQAQPTLQDREKLAIGLLDSLAGALRGAVAQTGGLPGDIRSIVDMIAQEGAEKYLGQRSFATTEELLKDTSMRILGTQVDIPFPPVLGEGATNIAERQPTVETAQEVGTFLPAPGIPEAAIQGAKLVGKAIKATKGLPVGMSIQDVGKGMDDLGFYSAAKQAVDAIQQPKGTGDQFLKQIEKTPGVKPDEIKWTGLDEFLKSKKSVTKAEVQEYLDKNRVEVKEVQLGDIQVNEKSEYALPEVLNVIRENQGTDFDRIRLALINDYDAYQALTNKFPNLEDTDNWGDRVLEDIIGSAGGGGPKFSKYTLPGGENYREVLLTFPSKNPEFDPKDLGRLNDLSNKTRTPSEDVEYKALAQRYDASLRGETTPEFKSSHFDQPNILAHLRVNDRVDADGKKVLFVEEVQSDWHQAGRKKGYGEKDVPAPTTMKVKEYINPYVNNKGESFSFGVVDNGQLVSGNFRTEAEALAEIERLRGTVKQMGIPDAPFKTTWSELAMKRAIQMASEGGYERIAFTTGKTQAERFDLSKQVERITAIKDGNNFKIMGIDTKGNSFDLGKKSVDELPEIVGKDLADKIAKQETPNAQYAGKDLVVGGEGMKGFYDDILPKFLNKYAKKWDAKAGMTEVPTTNAETFAEYLDRKGITESKYNASDSGTRQRMKQDFEQNAKKSGVPVHYIDITPKMRESTLTKGQPMFAIGAGGAGAAATQQEDNK